MQTIDELIRSAVLNREEADRFLDEQAPNWARFDSVLGYVLRDSLVQDGMDDSTTSTCIGPHGERMVVNGAGQPCRMNSYGNSFTLCQQVNNGETWQEYLAAHLCEPIRNFGVGGYGAYQAYRRMCREETGPAAAEYVFLNIYTIDDHLRSMDAWRWLRCIPWFRDPANKFLFHCNPWDHLRYDVDSGQFVERPSLCPTPESLYQLCDEAFVRHHFASDPVTLLYAGAHLGIDCGTAPIEPLAEAFGLPLEKGEARQASIWRLYLALGLHASMWVAEKAMDFARRNGKKLMFLLSFGPPELRREFQGLPREDEPFLRFLQERAYPHVDTLAAHALDFQSMNTTVDAYLDRYYTSHYAPQGNHFFAFAIKQAVVEWLDPKPLPYRGQGETMGFAGYLRA